jgi:hypothetical protein
VISHIKKMALDMFREDNCKAVTCGDCPTKCACPLYVFYQATYGYGKTDIELAVELLEAHGFHVTDVREERATPTDKGPVIDDSGTRPTGAILLRVVPQATEGAA